MEIVTFVVDGSLTHKDNMGTQETIGRGMTFILLQLSFQFHFNITGSIQFMTAGTGVRHSEFNASKTDVFIPYSLSLCDSTDLHY